MDQLFIVISGSFVTVLFYLMSPVKLSDWLLGLIERLGKNAADSTHAGKSEKARSYYVRNGK